MQTPPGMEYLPAAQAVDALEANSQVSGSTAFETSATSVPATANAPALNTAAMGATVPPWSAAHPYTNMHGPKAPTTATVVGNVQVNEATKKQKPE